MSKPKLTPWFPADVTPVREGVYETTFRCWTGYSHWDGYGWSNQQETKNLDAEWRSGASQNKNWRGLAQDPKVKK